MYLFQIQNLCNKHIRNKVFVSPCDMLPYGKVKLPFCAIINTSKASHPGTHWVGLIIQKDGTAYFFDSYGMPPYVKEIQYFIKMHSKKLVVNTQQIQRSNSRVCGLYAFFFIYFLINKSLSLKNYISHFSKNLYLNDKKVEILFERLIR
jgi:hypothetical protein